MACQCCISSSANTRHSSSTGSQTGPCHCTACSESEQMSFFYLPFLSIIKLDRDAYCMPIILAFFSCHCVLRALHMISLLTKNNTVSCAHYWLLSGIALAYAVYGPTYAATSPFIRGTLRSNPTFLWSCIAVWTVSTQSLLASTNPVPFNYARRTEITIYSPSLLFSLIWLMA